MLGQEKNFGVVSTFSYFGWVKENVQKLKYHKSIKTFHTISLFVIKLECHTSVHTHVKQVLESEDQFLLSHITK
ncbi:MAG: hypothetical protein U9Q66_01340 [Patescibacteria group bacterium]|nr:hypothetical protein [Patescibacteria group bacterium]